MDMRIELKKAVRVIKLFSYVFGLDGQAGLVALSDVVQSELALIAKSMHRAAAGGGGVLRLTRG